MSHSKQTLNETAEECRRLQIKAAERLREIATELRKKQKDMNIAKLAFHGAGLVANGVSLVGVLFVPFTPVFSIGLFLVGAAATAGGIGTSVVEWRVIGGLVEEADGILNELHEKMGYLFEKLDFELKLFGLSVDDLIAKGGEFARIARTFGQHIAMAVAIARIYYNARIAAGAAGNVAVAGGRAAVLRAARAGARPLVGVVGIGINLMGIIDDSIKIHQNVSPAADKIEKIAIALEEKVGETEL